MQNKELQSIKTNKIKVPKELLQGLFTEKCYFQKICTAKVNRLTD